ncbi:hypothetical protein [Klebsiella pneumoniae]
MYFLNVMLAVDMASMALRIAVDTTPSTLHSSKRRLSTVWQILKFLRG